LTLLIGCSGNENDNKTLFNEAIKKEESGQYKDAIEIYETILDNNPDSSTEEFCLYFISNLHGKLEDYYDQITWSEKLLEKNPNSSIAYSQIGSAFFGLEKYDLALENYWTATQLDTSVMTPFAAAILAEDYKKPEIAIKFYKECVKKDSLFTPAYYNLSVNLANIEDYKTAEIYCKMLMKLKPNDTKTETLYQDIISHLK
jgi:tetratricopeptide (TPR) repeat protein